MATGRTRRRFFTATHRHSDLYVLQSHFCTSSYLFFLRLLTLAKCRLFVSVASDVDPDNVAGQKTAEPAVVFQNAAEQATQGHVEEQPTVATATEAVEEIPAQAMARRSTPTRGDDAARAPPPSSVPEEGDKAPTPPPAEERRTPTPPQAGASPSRGSLGLVREPLIPVTLARCSADGEEAPAASNDEVEEIQGCPHDGRQHVYVWRQRGDHFIGHEELAETEEAARVDRAAKRLVDEVKVSDQVFN